MRPKPGSEEPKEENDWCDLDRKEPLNLEKRQNVPPMKSRQCPAPGKERNGSWFL